MKMLKYIKNIKTFSKIHDKCIENRIEQMRGIPREIFHYDNDDTTIITIIKERTVIFASNR